MFSNSSKYPAFFTIPLLWIIGYLFFCYLSIPQYFSLLDNLNLIIHEMGHFFFFIFGNEFLMMSWGTIMQVLIPSLILIYFWRNLDFFWVTLCLGWIGTNFFYIAMYSGDAIKQNLPLINVTGWVVKHDWYYIFSELWILQYTNQISSVFWGIGVLFFILSLWFWILLVINRWKGL
jgi:hypothetical protein